MACPLGPRYLDRQFPARPGVSDQGSADQEKHHELSMIAMRVNASVGRLKTVSLLTATETEDRLVISPVLRSLFDDEEET